MQVPCKHQNWVRFLDGAPNLCRDGREAQCTGLQNRKTVGSNPTLYAIIGLKVFMDAHKPVTLEEGDRYPLRPPKPALGP